MENTNENEKNKVWFWIIIVVIMVAFIFLALKSYKKDVPAPLTNEEKIKVTNIEGLVIGENPDIGVDDFSGLQVSQDEIIP